ncbi:tRNA-U16,U17-dihydrouridine synthase [Thalassococcus halodurans]|uniref:tRNA-dihydrouridine(20/20a) synthase n=1 Tax=Thalassococcus halodurans TaxID=373675 RepID=A0A1H5WJP5_9RHOB|nr:tRNA dihydrouridine(20/20a) synthase DusA [Thalassococcus halodurans]SEF99563.1 tRNA-U16,U17-dihydrouridine synthase [Thalassococcus halodurans]
MALPDDSKQIGQTDVRRAARLSVAPMMDWTDRHCRYFHRLLSQKTLLYTEMVTAPALVKGGALHLLDYAPEEHPVALQLGGSDPRELAQAARLGAQAGYDEINLNVGCPSDRVQSGAFGAVLMKDPGLVADCIKAMQDSVDVAVTVKCRIGVDDQEPSEVLPDFLSRVAATGCDRFTIHARKAWLQGLSPKENRDIPPLDYDLVTEMKGLFPALHISINGGITDIGTACDLLDRGLEGVMIGRAAYHQPWDILAKVDSQIFGMDTDVPDPVSVALGMKPYIQNHLKQGGRLHQITRHMLGLFAGRPGARHWRRRLSEDGVKNGADESLIDRALDDMRMAAAV